MYFYSLKQRLLCGDENAGKLFRKLLEFDSTLGFPGEGPGREWSNRLSMATWNARSMTKSRFDYCRDLGYDVLAITEMWNTAANYATGNVDWTYSKRALDPETHKPIFPDDPAAGVGILLSERATNKYMSHDSPCNRIC